MDNDGRACPGECELNSSLNNTNTMLGMKVVNDSYGSQDIGLSWNGNRIVARVTVTKFQLLHDGDGKSKNVAGETVVVTFSSGRATINVSAYCSKKPDVLILTGESGNYMLQYNFDETTSPNACVIYGRAFNGDPLGGLHRFSYIVVRN